MSGLIPSLPEEIAILCIARVPRSHHPFLAAVSRSWRALLHSPFFFSTRIEVGASQPFLFISIHSPTDQYHWYLLDPSLRRNDSLTPLPARPHPSILYYASVTLGHSLYLLGGLIDDEPSPIVQIYDARFNYWRRGPDMSVSRHCAHAGVISGRIYVIGGCVLSNEYWAEEFDSENDQWRRVPGLLQDIRGGGWMSGSGAVIGGKLFAMKGIWGCVIFDSTVAKTELVTQAEKTWSMELKSLVFDWVASVEEVKYKTNTNSIKIKWCDFADEEWMVVRKLPKFLCGAALANLGQELCFILGERWEGEKLEIICAGVRLTKINAREVQVSVEWEERYALPCPRETSIVDCLSLEF